MSKSPQGIGKGMIYAAWIAALILLTIFFNSFLEKEYNPNQQLTTHFSGDGPREVVLQRNAMGHYVASGSLNGVPVVFLLDTGATTLAISESLANRLELKRGAQMQMTTANGTITAYSTTIDRVTLGVIELRQVRASITPSMREEEVLLGMSFLKQLEFTQRGDTLIIRQNSQ